MHKILTNANWNNFSSIFIAHRSVFFPLLNEQQRDILEIAGAKILPIIKNEPIDVELQNESNKKIKPQIIQLK